MRAQKILVTLSIVILGSLFYGPIYALNIPTTTCEVSTYASSSTFAFTNGIAVDSYGNIYVADCFNNAIRKITSDGTVSTFAGNGLVGFSNGIGTNATFKNPSGVAVDKSGNLYVADTGNMAIRKITSNGIVSTFAGNGTSGLRNGIGTNASFNNPSGLAVDKNGNIYVADPGNSLIRKIDINALVSSFYNVYCKSLTVDSYGNVYTDGFFNKISTNGVKLTYKSPVVSYFASGLVIDNLGNLCVADTYNGIIRKFDGNGNASVFVGGMPGFCDGSGKDIAFCQGCGLAIDSEGNFYLADCINAAIRKLSTNGDMLTIAGCGGRGFYNGEGIKATMHYPADLAFDKSGNIYIADEGNDAIRKITTNGVVTTLVGGSPGRYYRGSIYGRTNGITNFGIRCLAVDKLGVTYAGNRSCILKILTNGDVSLLAGNTNVSGFSDGIGTNAKFSLVSSLVIDSDNNIYAADCSNNAIRKITSNGIVSTFAGGNRYFQSITDGVGTNATFHGPVSLALDAQGTFYVAEMDSNAIRKISSNGVVSTLAGNGSKGFSDGVGTNATFSGPQGIAVDNAGYVYVAEYGNNAIRKISSNGVVVTLAGTGVAGFSNGPGTNATFGHPRAIKTDTLGNLFVADNDNNAIRKITQTIIKGSQNIIFSSIPVKTYGMPPFQISAYSSSQLNVSFVSSNPSVATILGSTITIVGAGTTTIIASQLGSAFYSPAAPISQNLVVNKATNTINFVQPTARTYINSGTFALAATASGGTVSFTSGNTNLMMISASTATILGAGTVTVTASQVGNSNYLAATNVSRTVVINKAPQTITLKPTSPISFANIKSFTLSGSSSSGLPPTYTSSSPTVISVSGTTATVKAKGVATITATQSGNANYNAATPVAVSVTVQ